MTLYLWFFSLCVCMFVLLRWNPETCACYASALPLTQWPIFLALPNNLNNEYSNTDLRISKHQMLRMGEGSNGYERHYEIIISLIIAWVWYWIIIFKNVTIISLKISYRVSLGIIMIRFSWDRTSLALASLEPRNPPASVSWVMELKTRATMPNFLYYFL